MHTKVLEINNLCLKYQFMTNVNLKETFSGFFRGEIYANRIREVQALKNVSFSIQSGQVVGIIGSNGAGKSTLLKTIAGIYRADSGTINTFSHSISLLSLGAGFQNELSGYENIYLNGLLLGLTKSELDEQIDEVIDFSEIRDFIHNPVKTYSTGMKTRLSFSIACNVNPEILLIDEVLGVGDEAFRQKSQKKIYELIHSERTVLLVSHSLDVIKQLCSEVIWMHKGEIMDIGNNEKIIEQYRVFINSKKQFS